MSIIFSVAALLAASQGSNLAGPKDLDPMVCKKQAVTGTRFPTRICRLQSQWERISENHRRDFKEVVDAPQGQPSVAPPPRP